MSGRLPSSADSVTVSRVVSPVSLFTTALLAVTGTISSAKRPAACAAAVRCCDCKRVGILPLARDAVALGDDLGGVDHRHVGVVVHGHEFGIGSRPAAQASARARSTPLRLQARCPCGRRRSAWRPSRCSSGPRSTGGRSSCPGPRPAGRRAAPPFGRSCAETLAATRSRGCSRRSLPARRPARSTAARSACAASVGAGVALNAPR